MYQRISRFVIGAMAAASLLGAATETAYSQVNAFTNRADFLPAAGNTTLIDFNDQVISPATSTSYSGPLTLSGVTFTSNAFLFAVTPAYEPTYNLGDGAVLSFQPNSPSVLTVDIPAGTYAVGMDFGSIGGVFYTFSLSTGDQFVYLSSAAPDTTPAFAGFTSVVPITSLTVFASSTPMIDRFVFVGPAPAVVPEAGSLVLALPALVMVGAVLVRRRKR